MILLPSGRMRAGGWHRAGVAALFGGGLVLIAPPWDESRDGETVLGS